MLSELKCNLESQKGVRALSIVGEIMTEIFKNTMKTTNAKIQEFHGYQAGMSSFSSLVLAYLYGRRSSKRGKIPSYDYFSRLMSHFFMSTWHSKSHDLEPIQRLEK